MAILKRHITQTVSISGNDVEANNNTIATPTFFHIESSTEYPATLSGTSGWYIENSNAAPDGHYVFKEAGTVLPGVMGSIASGGEWHGDGTLPYLPYDSGDDTYNAGSKEIKSVANISDNTSTSALNMLSAVGKFILITLTNIPAAICKVTGFTMESSINMATNRILNLPEPSTDAEPMRKIDTYNKFLQLNPATDTQSVFKKVLFRNNAPYLTDDSAGFSLQQLITRKYLQEKLDTFLAGITSGDITAAQISLNIINVMVSGTQEDNRIYNTISAAKTIAESFATTTFRFNILIWGNGDGAAGSTYTLPAGLLGDFVGYTGINKNVIVITEDSTYTGSANTPVNNCTLNNINDAANSIFTDVPFSNVIFDNTFGTGIYTFDGCHFGDGCEFTEDVATMDFSAGNNTGRIYDRVNLQYIYLSPDIGGTVTMAAAIALNNDGKVYPTTGGTTVSRMETSNFRDGNKVTLIIGTNVTINHASSSAGTYRPFQMNAGANKALTVGQTISFVLYNDIWYEL